MIPILCLIWSNEHNAWWRAQSAGYSRSLHGAGVYDWNEAHAIVTGARDGWHSLNDPPTELLIRLDDLPDNVRQLFALHQQTGVTIKPA